MTNQLRHESVFRTYQDVLTRNLIMQALPLIRRLRLTNYQPSHTNIRPIFRGIWLERGKQEKIVELPKNCADRFRKMINPD